MPGFSDYLAQAGLNFVTMQQPFPATAARWLALFTAAPNDAGTGGTEVSGGAYARVQVAGSVTAGASFAASATTITLSATVPSWVTVGMNVYDTTKAANIATVAAGSSGTTLNITAAATSSSGAADSLLLSAWPASTASSGAEPSTTAANVTNGSVITFAQATASWGTVIAFGLYDASSAGNLLMFDFLGNFKWVPFSCSSASPGVLSVDLASDAPANGTPCVVTSKFGGTLPTTAGSWAGVLTSAGLSSNTFNLGVNTTAIGGGNFRQIVQQSIPTNVTASFAASTLTLSLA
jgi:hypothetical protein